MEFNQTYIPKDIEKIQNKYCQSLIIYTRYNAAHIIRNLTTLNYIKNYVK